jgi:ABC-type molybdate transport system ATPase subunit
VNRFCGRVRKVIENHAGYHVLVDVNGETIVADTPAVSRPAAALAPGEPVHGLIRLCDLKSM